MSLKTQGALWICLIIVMQWVSGCSDRPSSSAHLRFGNPSLASLSNPENYLMVKPQFALSYNQSLGRANWASWQLDTEWLGETDRQNDFRPDPALPPNWEPIKPNDYRRSGYDRGHLVPSGDRTLTPADNSATFVMTNIVPQAPDNNQGPWRDFEDTCRQWVNQGKELYIVAGGYGNKKTIAQGKITPPYRMWKAVLILNSGQTQIDETTPLIAIDLPNGQGIRDDHWQKYQVSVDQIEAKTGYDLFSALDDTVESSLEKQINRTFAIATTP